MTNVQLLIWRDLAAPERLRLLQRAQVDISAAISTVTPIIEDVRDNGVEALCRWVHQLDSPGLAAVTERDLAVTADELSAAQEAVEAYGAGGGDGMTLRAAITGAVENVIRFHEAQPRPHDWEVEICPGVFSGERVSPLGSVGLYVPRGKGSFPSVVYMLTVPAYIAGVEEIAVCTPADAGGQVDAAGLFTAQLVAEYFGRHATVYKIGGAPAIAALAYGVGPVPRVAKVLGPGNEYVTAAKRVLSGVLDVGVPAGPSEAVIVCDEHADLEAAAYELVVEAEHGPRSAAVALTHDRGFARRLASMVGHLVDGLPEPQRSYCRSGFSTYGGVVLTSSLDESLEIASLYAGEHVRVLTSSPRQDSLRIRDAGELLLGEYSSIPLGNFCVGLNAVLPTGGFARSFSGVGVESFLKRTSIAEVSPEGTTSLSPIAEALAAYEGFEAHRAAAALVRRRADRAPETDGLGGEG